MSSNKINTFLHRRLKIVTAVIFGVAGFLAMATHFVLPYASPQQTFRTLVTAMQTGDLERLSTSEALGTTHVVYDRIMSAGRAEYNRIVAIYDKRLSEGRTERNRRINRLNDIRTRSESLGASAFDRLSDEQRWDLWVGMTRREWTFAHAHTRVTDEQRELIPTLAVLDDPGIRREFLLDLGCVETGEDAVAVREAVRAGVMSADDPMIIAVLDECIARGEREIRSAEGRVQRYMDRADPDGAERPPEDDAPGALANERDRKAELGFAALNPDEKAFWNSNESLYVDQSNATLERLGQSHLSSAEAAEIAGQTYAAFQDARDTFIPEQGAVLLRGELIDQWDGCGFHIESVRSFAALSGGRLRSRGAELRWTPTGSVRLFNDDLWNQNDTTLTPGDVLPAVHQHPGAVAPDTSFRTAFRQGRVSPASSASVPCDADLPDTMYFYPYRGQWRIAWGDLPNTEPRPEPSERRRRW